MMNMMSNIAMKQHNIDKILSGRKVFTCRTFKLDNGTYTLSDGSTITLSGSYVHRISELDIIQQHQWAIGEGFESLHDIRFNSSFNHTKEFVEHKRGLYIYRITHLNGVPHIDNTTDIPFGKFQEKITNELGIYINESAKHHLPKEKVKTRMSTQFIGDGSRGSSTDNYRMLYDEYNKANTGSYSDSSIVYVSSNGKRRNRVEPILNGRLLGEYRNIDKVIDNNGIIVMDTLDHLNNTSRYNIGELALANYMKLNRYKRKGTTGIWLPI